MSDMDRLHMERMLNDASGPDPDVHAAHAQVLRRVTVVRRRRAVATGSLAAVILLGAGLAFGLGRGEHGQRLATQPNTTPPAQVEGGDTTASAVSSSTSTSTTTTIAKTSIEPTASPSIETVATQASSVPPPSEVTVPETEPATVPATAPPGTHKPTTTAPKTTPAKTVPATVPAITTPAQTAPPEPTAGTTAPPISPTSDDHRTDPPTSTPITTGPSTTEVDTEQGSTTTAGHDDHSQTFVDEYLDGDLAVTVRLRNAALELGEVHAEHGWVQTSQSLNPGKIRIEFHNPDGRTTVVTIVLVKGSIFAKWVHT